MSDVAVVGGGIVGMVAAHLLRQQGKRVFLIEAGPNLGGLLRGPTIDGNSFDYGTHVLATTQVPEIDNFFLEDIDPKVFNLFSGYQSDCAGSFSSSGWNEETGFVDLRDNDLIHSVIDWALNANCSLACDNASEKLHSMYGPEAVIYFRNQLEKIYGIDVAGISTGAIKLLGLHRTVLPTTRFPQFSEVPNNIKKIFAHSSKAEFQSAFPPPDVLSIYPKKRGLYQVVDFLEEKLLNQGVTIFKNCSVNYNSQTLQVKSAEKTKNFDKGFVIWTAGLPSASKTFLKSFPPKSDGSSKISCIVNVILSHANLDRTAMYYWIRHAECMTYRLTNYAGLTCNPSEFGFSLEMTVPKHFTVEDIKGQAFHELSIMGLIANTSDVEFFSCNFMPYSFLNMTVDFEKWARDTSEYCSDVVKMFGPWSAKDQFFMRDCLTYMYENLNR